METYADCGGILDTVLSRSSTLDGDELNAHHRKQLLSIDGPDSSEFAQVGGGAIMLADFEANATTYVDSSNFTVRSEMFCEKSVQESMR